MPCDMLLICLGGAIFHDPESEEAEKARLLSGY